MKWVLWPIGWLYGILMEVRRLLYRKGIKSITRMPVPVIVVGNISVGGTGKTPIVIWLAQELRSHGYRVGIVSRGYGGLSEKWPQLVSSESDPTLVGDEPVLLARATSCPVMVGQDRVSAAKVLLSVEPLDLLISDDGLQHYKLGRALEIMVVDGMRGLGNGLCLPAGPLREFGSRLTKSDAVIVNGEGWECEGAYRVQPVAQSLYQVSGSTKKTLEEFREKQVHAVAGIGNPKRFFDTLKDAGIDVLPHPLPDHANLSQEDIEFNDSRPVLITEKDAVKCQHFAHNNVWCLPIKMEFQIEDKQRLMNLVLGKL
jgi:tetraacyldisaccharide 4'-kinase